MNFYLTVVNLLLLILILIFFFGCFYFFSFESRIFNLSELLRSIEISTPERTVADYSLSKPPVQVTTTMLPIYTDDVLKNLISQLQSDILFLQLKENSLFNEWTSPTFEYNGIVLTNLVQNENFIIFCRGNSFNPTCSTWSINRKSKSIHELDFSIDSQLGVQFSPDGSKLMLAGKNLIRIMSASGEYLREIKSVEAPKNAIFGTESGYPIFIPEAAWISDTEIEVGIYQFDQGSAKLIAHTKNRFEF